MIIRAIRKEDAEGFYAIRTMEGVRENILSLPSDRVSETEAYIGDLTPNDHILVAEEGGKVIGAVSLHISPKVRQRHTAGIGIMVHAAHQGKGVGKALMQAILDLADRWLMLKRVELTVYADNERAIHLYESMGFIAEGTKKYAAARDGEYVDELLMARCKF